MESNESRTSSWSARSARPSSSWFGGSSKPRSSSVAPSGSPDDHGDENLLSAYQQGDVDLLEACLAAISAKYRLEDVFSKLAGHGKLKAADWTNTVLDLGIDDAFVAGFDNSPGAHNREEQPEGPAVRKSLSRANSFVITSRRGSMTSKRNSRLSVSKDTVATLHRAFGLLSRLLARRRLQQPGTQRRGSSASVEREDFGVALQVVQRARDCAERIAHVRSARGKQATRLATAKCAMLLAEHAAAAAEVGSYQSAHEDLKALLLLCDLEPHVAVRSCIHGRPPAAQLLGFVIRTASRELLMQERLEATCPHRFGALEAGLRLCAELTRLNKALMRPPELQQSSSSPNLSALANRLLSRRRASDGGDHSVASSAVAAAERLLNIVHPRTVSMALAPVAFISDSAMVEKLIHSGWALLDEATISESNCNVRASLADIATHMGIAPPEFAGAATVVVQARPSAGPSDGAVEDMPSSPSSVSSTPGTPSKGDSQTTTDVARAVVDLEHFIHKRTHMARSAALYGGAFLLERVLDHFHKTRVSQRSSTSNSRRTSMISALRRDSGGGAQRSSTVSWNSRPSAEDLGDLEHQHRRASRAETWAGLASTHRLFDAMRPHLPPLFFEGRHGRVIPDPSDKLRRSVDSQLEQEAEALRARGWLQPGEEWSDLVEPTKAGDDARAASRSSKDTGSKAGDSDSNRDTTNVDSLDAPGVQVAEEPEADG